jgi:uncharacterized protein (DUF1330 family)
MGAYIIVIREGAIRDPAAYEEYLRRIGEEPPAPAATPLVAYGAIQELDGEAPDGVVLLQFDTMEDARQWYRSPGYQAALPHRLRSGEWRAFIVEGL